MTESEFLLRGPVLHLKESKDPNGSRISHSIQLMKRNAKGAFELLNVKLFDGADPAKFAPGTPVEVAIDISFYEGTAYYRATRDLSAKSDSRAADTNRPVAAKL